MRIELKKTPEQIELIKACGSRDPIKAHQARETLAALLSPTVNAILQQADTMKNLFRDITFNEDEDPSFPVELFTGISEGYFNIWSQSTAGGLPTNTFSQALQEIKFTTYRLDSAISFADKYARKSRLDVVSKAIERLLQEILLKIQRNGWAVILAGLANGNNGGKQTVMRAQTAGIFTLEDLNAMMTRMRRMNAAWDNGTPDQNVGKLTDLYISPEVKEGIRGFAYNPINTRGPNNVAITAASDQASAGGIALSQAERAGLWGSGSDSLFNVNLVELNELGKGQRYNTLFDEYAGSTTYSKADGSTGSAVFAGDTTEICIGFDLTQDFAYRALSVNADSGASFVLVPDTQWSARSAKMGLYGSLEEGRLLLQTKNLLGLII